jgi:hypothetical protein
MNTEYRHRQIGGVIIAAIVTGLVFILLPFWMSGSFHPIQVALIILLVVTLGVFHSLTVEITNGRLSCRFGPGVIHKTFLVSEIKDVRSVRNPWYAGWGIRYKPGRYWLWNVSRFLAVELVLEDGKVFRIGTDEPELLIQAIHMNGVLRTTNTKREI